VVALLVGGVASARTTGSPSEQFGGRLGGGSGGPASSGPPPDGPAGVPPDDRPDFPPEYPQPADLSGQWVQDGAAGAFFLDVAGNQVIARRGQPWICGPAGPAPANGAPGALLTNDRHFEGQLAGRDLVGQVAVCWSGNGEAPTWAMAPLRLTVDPDGEQFVGSWHDDFRDDDVSVALSRVPIPLLAAEDFGLPPTNLRIYGYGIKKVYRQNGLIVTVPEDYVLDPEADDEVVRHLGIDYTSRNDRWVLASLPFATPVAGTVHLVSSSPWNTIALQLVTGDWLQILHASAIQVQDGQHVAGGTILGTTGSTGASTLHLHIQARTSRGDPANPDVIVALARQVISSNAETSRAT
jgi:Peptidase family M23